MALPNDKDTVYNTKTLSKWFAIGSIILLFTIVWGLIEDYDRPWKQFVRQHQKLKTAASQRKIKATNKTLEQAKLKDLEKEILAVEEERADLINEIDAKIKREESKHYAINMEFQSNKSVYESILFRYNVALKKQDEGKLKSIGKELAEQQKVIDRLGDQTKKAEQAKDQALADKKDILSKKRKLDERLSRLTSSLEQQKKVVRLNDTNLLNVVRNAPLIDLVNPSVKIKQIVLPHLTDDYHFNKVGRVDRCITCHANIDKKGFEDLPQPYTSHSQLDLYLSATSSHPIEKVGCTVCHAGQGPSTDFSHSGHMPKDEAQEQEWKEKYDFFRNHHLETPMIPTKLVQGKCIQCHAKEIHLEGAPTFNAGMQIIEKVGCYNCHKFKGHFEELNKVKKVGPSLKMISSKVTKEWATKWLWDPKAFRPTTTMPSFFKLHNNSDPESLKRSAVEVEAIISYLFKNSEKYEPIGYPEAILPPSEANGKKLVGSLGCLACHASDDFPRKNPDFSDSEYPKALGQKDPRVPMFGPELNQMGSKVGKEWLFSWLQNPTHYWDNTSMPNMRLNDTEARDIAAYLLAKKNSTFEQSTYLKPSDEDRDNVMMEYYQKQYTIAEAKEKIAGMKADEKIDFIGKKMISHYGCYSCHAIKGFEDGPQIGAELTYEGSKDISKFTFDNVKVHHTRPDWIVNKILAPRTYDIGVKRDFESKTRMPHFGFTKKQAEAVAAVVIGYEKSNVDKSAQAPITGKKEKLIKGHQLMRQKNCMGCHAIEKRGGFVHAFYEDDPNEGPPSLNKQGNKTKPKWLHSFLMKPEMIRPWLSIRMPSFNFSEKESGVLAQYFAAFDDTQFPFKKDYYEPISDKDYAQAAKLFDELACLSCHGLQPPAEDLAASAPLLDNVKERLQGDYVVDWLKRPGSIMPGTRMPELWPLDDDEDPNSKRIAVPGYFDDDAEKQIRMIRNFLGRYKKGLRVQPQPISAPSTTSEVVKPTPSGS